MPPLATTMRARAGRGRRHRLLNLMPDADHREVPPMAELQREFLGAVGAEHRADGLPAVQVGGGLRLGSIDGTVTRMPDTRANREAFGTAGAAETGYPQIRHLHACDALTRATLAVVTGPAGGDRAQAEQTLLDRRASQRAPSALVAYPRGSRSQIRSPASWRGGRTTPSGPGPNR